MSEYAVNMFEVADVCRKEGSITFDFRLANIERFSDYRLPKASCLNAIVGDVCKFYSVDPLTAQTTHQILASV